MLPALPVSAEASGVFTLSDRTEARVRAPDQFTNAAGIDLDTLVDARATWKSRSTAFLLADDPRLTGLDLNGSARQLSALDSVLASAEWHSLRARIRLSENASYGAQSFQSLSALPPPGAPQEAPAPGQPTVPVTTIVPTTSQALLFASSETAADSTLLVDRWSLFSRVGYKLAGGADSVAQQYLPFAQGPVAQGIADLTFPGRSHDHLITLANGSETSFSTGSENILASVEEQWSRRWARRTETIFGTGWYVLRSRAGFDQPDVSASSPMADAAVEQRFVHGKDSAEVRAEVRLWPVLNPLTGLVDEQIRGSLEGAWVHRHLNLRAFVSAGESIDEGTATAVRQATAEVDTAYAMNRWLTFDFGVRGLYQSQNESGTPAVPGGPAPITETTFGQVVVFVAATWQAMKVRF